MAFADLLRQLDAEPYVRGRQFERICAWYLRTAPEYRSRLRRVWLWSDWPEAWAADAGIDLVAEEHTGGLWAIQAKAYQPTYAIRKADVDSFLSESARPGFSYRLLIATTDRLGPTARRTLESQREPVGYLLRSQLEAAHVEWPLSPDELRPSRPAPKKPLPHVREAINTTVRGLRNTDRGQLVMACGTGKTLGAMWVAERLRSARTLVLVPSLSLLAQTLREWSANATEPFEYLAVCSDQTVAGGDDFVQHTAELGLPVTTDPDVIAQFLRRRGQRVVFATYQSSLQVAAAFRGRTTQFDLAIADEAHRCAGRVSSEFATILDPTRIKARRRLFMTATPRYYTARLRREAGALDVEVASMDDAAAFGPVLHRLSFGEAIDRQLLSDYQVVVVGVEDAMYHAWAERGELVTRDRQTVTDARTLGAEIALAKAMRKYDLRRVISFHGRVKAARQFSAELPEVIAWMPQQTRPTGPIWSHHISGAMPSGRRDRLLLRFRDLAPRERGVVSNARCLSEGVDVPTLDGVAFIDPRHSTIDIIQAVGRAIRKAPDKSRGTIVLPVFLTDADPEEALRDSTFSHVWEVLKALRAHDERLGEELDLLRQRLGTRRSPPSRPEKIKLDVPVARVGASFAEAFDIRLVERTTQSWEFWYGLLERYYADHGTSHVPSGYASGDGARLGFWVQNQRAFYRRGQLPQGRVARLEQRFPDWTWRVYDTKWDSALGLLREFRLREGHAAVPLEHKEDGFSLGAWVNIQRQDLRTGRLAPERKRALENVEGWRWRLQEPRWGRAFALLETYYEEHGTTRVPTTYKDPGSGFALGRWVVNQRQERRAGSLSLQRQRQLDRAGDWTWDTGEDRWELGFELLVHYARRHGHTSVPTDYRPEGFPLRNWVGTQRAFFRKGKLGAQRARRLEQLSGWAWHPLDGRWEVGLAELSAFVADNGHARVPQQYITAEGFKLGIWVANQRRRRGRLTPEKRVRLDRLLSV